MTIDLTQLFQERKVKTLIEEAHEVAHVLLEVQRKLKLPSQHDNIDQILFRLRFKQGCDPNRQRVFETIDRLLFEARRQIGFLVHAPGKRIPRKNRIAHELACAELASRLTGVPLLASDDVPFG